MMLADGLYERLIASGLSRKVSGSLATDVHDIEEGLAEIVELLVATDGDAVDRFTGVEQECALHLRYHVTSLERTAKRLRKQARKTGLR